MKLAMVGHGIDGRKGTSDMMKQLVGRCGLGMASAAMAVLLAGCGQNETATQDQAAAPAEATATAPAAPAAPTEAATADPTVPANLATNPQTALAAMQGDWVGIEDPKSTLKVTGNQLVMGYADDSASDETFRIDFVTECEGRPISGPRLGFTLTADDMVLCYTDLEADADNLEYFYAPRGNRQAFRRPAATAAR